MEDERPAVDPAEQAQMKEVISFLLSPQLEARAQALDIILAYTGNDDKRRLFCETDCCKELLRLLPETDDASKLKIVKILINLAQDTFFII
jgi:hypothetical protein